MARPRVFVSSTYYDLKYVRSSLEQFIESLGYDAVLSEKGDIAYAPDLPLDESCYREVQNCDIYVLLVGGRYGSEASGSKTELPKNFYDRYESITKLEFKAAVDKDIPIYVMIEKAVYAEYHTFLRNREIKDVAYAHVDSVNVFHFVETILSQPRNNPVQAFDRYSEIEGWLREQWSGLFRELLARTSSQQQIASLAAQVSELGAVNETLKRYLEEVIAKVSPQDAAQLIKKEGERLGEARARAEASANRFVRFLSQSVPEQSLKISDLLLSAATSDEFVESLSRDPELQATARRARNILSRNGAALNDANAARAVAGAKPFGPTTIEPLESMDLTVFRPVITESSHTRETFRTPARRARKKPAASRKASKKAAPRKK